MNLQIPEAAAPPHGALLYVAAVNIVIWVGLFAYLFYLDRRVRAAEVLRGAPSPPPAPPAGLSQNTLEGSR